MQNVFKPSHHRLVQTVLVWILFTGISACSPSNETVKQTATASVPLPPVATAVATATALPPSVWIDPATPARLLSQIELPAGYQQVSTAESAAFRFGPLSDGGKIGQIYALAAPFYTLPDEMASSDLIDIWSGADKARTIVVDEETARLFADIWGKPAANVRSVANPALENFEPNDSTILFIIPLDQLQPTWKVLRVDGIYPLSHDVLNEAYPLSISFGFSADGEIPAELGQITSGLHANFDPDLLSIVAMTGTTALTRATAHQMDINGVTWPGKDIGPYLRNADITHISNEVSFYEFCSKGNPNETSMMFCSRPEYLELLSDVGTDLVELTGNHNLDYGRKPYTDSLDMYAKAGMKVYGGGLTEDDARAPLLIDDHGNKFAFMGCNFVGPKNAMATKNTMGAAHCDFEWFTAKISELRAQGYLPIFTFQYSEYLIYRPGEHQERDFKRMADAGALVVSGSQAHFPQIMDVYNGSFIHYGPGNLFFDQMDRPVVGTREEFVDRHYFFNGRYLGTELVTALLEDFARPRPMTELERADFLARIFDAAMPYINPTPTPSPTIKP